MVNNPFSWLKPRIRNSKPTHTEGPIFSSSWNLPFFQLQFFRNSWSFRDSKALDCTYNLRTQTPKVLCLCPGNYSLQKIRQDISRWSCLSLALATPVLIVWSFITQLKTLGCGLSPDRYIFKQGQSKFSKDKEILGRDNKEGWMFIVKNTGWHKPARFLGLEGDTQAIFPATCSYQHSEKRRSGVNIPWRHHLLMPQRSRLFFDFPFIVIVVPETEFIITLHPWFFSSLWLHTEYRLLIRTLFKHPPVSNSSEAWEGNLIFAFPVPQATLWGTIGKEAVGGS